MKNIIDKYVPYPLSLQHIYAASRWDPKFISGRKIFLYGWAPSLKEVCSFLPSETSTLSGHIFVSDLQLGSPHELGKLKVKLTVPDEEACLIKEKEIIELDLQSSVHIRTREFLWERLTKIIPFESKIEKDFLLLNKRLLLSLLEVDEAGNLVRTIYEHVRDYFEFKQVIKDFRSIPSEILLHLASLLNYCLVPLCQHKYQLKLVIKSLCKIKDDPSSTGKKYVNFWQISSLLLKTLSKCQNGYHIQNIIDEYLKISPLERNAISKFLNTRIFYICQDGNQLCEVLNCLTKIENPYKRDHIMDSLGQEIFNKCQNGTEVGALIKTLANMKLITMTQVIDLIKGEILDKCQGGYQVAEIINTLADIPTEDTRQHAVILLKERFLANCVNGLQVRRVIKYLAEIKDKKMRNQVVNLFYRKCLDKCQDGYQVSKIIKALSTIPQQSARIHVMSYLRANSKILAKCQDGNQVKKIIRALADIPAKDVRERVVALLEKKMPPECQDGDQLEQIIYALATLLPFNIEVII